MHQHQAFFFNIAITLHHNLAGALAAARSTPDAASALLAADYNSDEEEASIQGSAPTAAEARDGSHSANGLPQGFFEVILARYYVHHALFRQLWCTAPTWLF